MIFHPVFSIIFFTLIMFLVKKQTGLFKFIALSSPILSLIFLILSQGEYSYELYNLKLIWLIDDFNKLIGIAFLLVLLVSNSYALGQKKYYEIIFGSA